VVATYWSGRWDLRGQTPHETELLSDPCVNFVFEAGGAHAGSRLVGVWTRLWRRTLQDRGYVRGIKLRAGAVRAFVNTPAFHFTNRILPLSDVLGTDLTALEQRVLAPESDEEAFLVLQAWLEQRRLDSDAQQVRLAIELAQRIANDPELTSVEVLARSAGLSRRALQRLFRDFLGASPKWVIRRNRLQEVALRIERGQAPTLAALAAELGYTDQAHLARDFKSAVGKSPSDFQLSVRVGVT